MSARSCGFLAGLLLACGAPRLLCNADLVECAPECVDLSSDRDHCGSCDRACDSGAVCVAGRCVPPCSLPRTRCGSGAAEVCADTASDPANCGACGAACATEESCVLGICRVGCSGGGWTRCDGRCFDTSVDETHCGGCDRACGSGEVCAGGSCLAAAEAPPTRLVVSLTADDAYDEQYTIMAPALEAHGMRGTFFVNAGRIDGAIPRGTFLTTARLQSLQADGHEIGSHGLDHIQLTPDFIPLDRMKREICDSRVDLLGRGFEVRSLAYPFGEWKPITLQLTEQCGYVSGRGVGQLTTRHPVDTIPPTNPLLLQASSSVKGEDSLESIEKRVLDAEAKATGQGPGWLIINFHRFCPGSACDPGLAWDPDLFRQFVGWLAARKDGGTVVRTLSQVAPGPLKPPVPSGTPLVVNGDFENDVAGPASPPDCWRVGATAGEASFSYVPGRTGMAAQITVTGSASPSAYVLQDWGPDTLASYRSCGTPVTPGHTYTFSCWYKSDVRVSLRFRARKAGSLRAQSWTTSVSSPASPHEWTQKSVTLTAPDGASSVFFGPSLAQTCTTDCLNPDAATLVVDDCSVVDEG